jgi:hypothetical protein
MHKLISITALISLGLITGCATIQDPIVQIGTDTYKVGGLERYKDYSSSALKAQVYQDAYRYCAAKNKVMVPLNGAGQSSTSSNSASDLQFQCVARSQAHSPSGAPTL